MARFFYKDNAVGQLASDISSVATSIVLNSGEAANFTDGTYPDGTKNVIATLVQYNTPTDVTSGVAKREKIEVTSVNTGTDTLTVTRGYDSTTPLSFNENDYIYIFLTEDFIDSVYSELDDLGIEGFTITDVASSVNEVEVVSAVAGDPVEINAIGDDTNIDLEISAKGTGEIVLDAVRVTPYALSDSGGDIDIDASLGNVFHITLDGNHDFTAPTNPTDWKVITLVLTQDATGTRVPTWNAAFAFSGGTAPTLTTDANAIDYLQFIYNPNDTKWHHVGEKLNL